MSASVTSIESAAEKRDERRRTSSLLNMARSFRSMAVDAEKIATMGDASRAQALKLLKQRQMLVSFTGEALRQESLELAKLAAELEEGGADVDAQSSSAAEQ